MHVVLVHAAGPLMSICVPCGPYEMLQSFAHMPCFRRIPLLTGVVCVCCRAGRCCNVPYMVHIYFWRTMRHFAGHGQFRDCGWESTRLQQLLHMCYTVVARWQGGVLNAAMYTTSHCSCSSFETRGVTRLVGAIKALGDTLLVSRR